MQIYQRNITQKVLSRKQFENIGEDITELDIIQINRPSVKFQAQIDPWNCGRVCIGNIQISCKRPEPINKAIEELLDFLDEQIQSRNCVTGTISQSQKEIFGDVLEKAGWKVELLFNNNNSGNDCYLISKEF